MQPHELPVYKQKEKILSHLADSQVIVVESPTGSGKTTQLPMILYEAGYARGGVLGITQPRRIAAVSVCDYIAKQLDTTVPGIAGYKMRFEDQTNADTRIKIMTDGILLQEIKADPLLSQYSAIMVDEAHERSLNIDFVLGLLKRIIDERPEFKVIVSSATINAEVFSEYFGECPIVHIEAEMYPVTTIYDPPAVQDGQDALILKVAEVVSRIVEEKRPGDMLIFLSGERIIKDCTSALMHTPFRNTLHILPLYGRLSKEEQELVFDPPPPGKTKVVVATNIAETSVTIDGITSVIDSGLAKVNYYNPRNFTSSLVETSISKASCNQRRGRAGRTRPGVCYRLYSKDDFEGRHLFTTEEIYRTDLSEVVLRMADLGIPDFESFDFLSPPSRQGIIGAVETLRLLEALTQDSRLSEIGRRMVAFPLMPYHSRIIVEAMMRYPEVMEEVLIAAAFLTSNSPFLLPQGEEIEARKAHHAFRDPMGDFVSYLKLFRAFRRNKDREAFCTNHYLDLRVMSEIVNVQKQLAEIVVAEGAPISSGGHTEDYLCAVARGLMQFVCVRTGRMSYRSLTAERILIHPGSVMFRENPLYIVAGEIVRTSRMYARSVSPLKRTWLGRISPELARALIAHEEGGYGKQRGTRQERAPKRDTSWQITLGSETFELKPYKKKKKLAILPWERISPVVALHGRSGLRSYKGLRGTVTYRGYELFTGYKLSNILKLIPVVDLEHDLVDEFPREVTYQPQDGMEALVDKLDLVLKVSPIKSRGKRLGFVGLHTDGSGTYWFKSSKSFHDALEESLASVETLADEIDDSADRESIEKVGETYRRLAAYFN
jgi:RNA helicase HrpA